jgi:hypothetical protein
MRVNLYHHEITDRVELRSKKAEGTTYSGIQFFIGHPVIHKPGDDDGSAVTFWFSNSKDRAKLKAAFARALALLEESR